MTEIDEIQEKHSSPENAKFQRIFPVVWRLQLSWVRGWQRRCLGDL